MARVRVGRKRLRGGRERLSGRLCGIEDGGASRVARPVLVVRWWRWLWKEVVYIGKRWLVVVVSHRIGSVHACKESYAKQRKGEEDNGTLSSARSGPPYQGRLIEALAMAPIEPFLAGST